MLQGNDKQSFIFCCIVQPRIKVRFAFVYFKLLTDQGTHFSYSTKLSCIDITCYYLALWGSNRHIDWADFDIKKIMCFFI